MNANTHTTPSPRKNRQPKKQPGKKRWGCLFKSFLLLALFGGGLVALLTPWGLARLTPLLASRLSAVLDLEVRIEGLALHWPLAASVDAFSATDDEGEVRLGLSEARVRISLRQLLRKQILIHRLEAEELLFAGLPEDPETEPDASPLEFPLRLPDLEEILDGVEVRHLQIKRLVLAPPLLPEPHVFSLEGQWRSRELLLEATVYARGEKRFDDAPRMKASLTMNAFDEEDVRDLLLEIRAASFAQLIPNGSEDLFGEMELDLTLRETRHEKIEMLTGRFRTESVNVEADGELHLETGMAKVDVHVDFPDLARFQAWSPVSLAGTLRAGLSLEGRVDDPEFTFSLLSDELWIAGHELRIRHFRHRGNLDTLARRGDLEAEIAYQDMPIQLSTGFTFEDDEFGLSDFSFTAADAEIAGHLSARFDPLALEGAVTVSSPDFAPIGQLFDMDLTGNARLRLGMSAEDGEQTFQVDDLAVNWDGLKILAESPLHVLVASGEWRVRPWTVRVGPGRLRARGGMEGEQLDLNVELLDLPLGMFGFTDRMGSGTELEGLFTLSGTLQDPAATLKLDLTGLRPEDPELWDGPPAHFQVELALRDQRLQGGFLLKNLPGDPVSLNLDIPAPLSLSPFSFQWPPEGEVEARFSANTDLEGLGRLFVLDVYHRLVGTLAADITLEGTFDEPRLEGNIRLDGGRYEHELSGTILADIILDVVAEREFLSLVNFSASDGADGTLQASGRLHFRPGERYPFETTLTLNRFRLLKNDHAEALGRGTVNWNGNLDESKLDGQMRVSPMTLNIPETLPPRLYALEVVEVHGSPEEDEIQIERETAAEAPAEDDESRARHRVAFDLRIDAPDRVFVRGRGLDSEWSARIRIQGQTPEPQITGSLNIIRGRFSFFGKRLVLERGVVTFDGSFPPEPLLDVEANLRSGGITAIIRVQGPAIDPEIELDSSPPMPQDEILARLLFGREAARITPWQAITLAQAVNVLRGGGSAFDLMGETRRVLRVDQVDVRTPDDQQDGTTVTVGKYISDRVYVELERNVAEESGRATVEVELTPSLRLETQAGGNADSGIGIIWTRDY